MSPKPRKKVVSEAASEAPAETLADKVAQETGLALMGFIGLMADRVFRVRVYREFTGLMGRCSRVFV